jgi:hypothetical protein
MGDELALPLFFAIAVALAAPLFPLARRLARQCIHNWKDVVLVLVLMPPLGYLTFQILSAVAINLFGLVKPLIDPIIRWGLAGSNIGQGAIIFIFVWIGPVVVAVFCLACLATWYINAWWNRRSRGQ